MEYTYRDFFSTAQASFWTHRFLCLLVLLPCFGFTSSTSAKHFPLRTFFTRKTKKKLLSARWGKEGGGVGVMPFLVKNCCTLSAEWASALVHHPSWNGQMHWRSLKKNSLKPSPASHNNASWHTDTDVFLGHSPSHMYYKGPAVQKIILGFLGPPPCTI